MPEATTLRRAAALTLVRVCAIWRHSPDRLAVAPTSFLNSCDGRPREPAARWIGERIRVRLSLVPAGRYGIWASANSETTSSAHRSLVHTRNFGGRRGIGDL